MANPVQQSLIRYTLLTVFVCLASVGHAAPAAAADAKTVTANRESTAIAIFAGGCFWCMEHPFDELPGVISTTSGYTGGRAHNPTYEQVSAGRTGHTESVEVRYDPTKVSYEKLLDVFWRNIDPLAIDRQFCDAGNQYRTAIFYSSVEQQKAADASKQAVHARFNESIATQIVAAGRFYPAEDYHQDYYRKHPTRYKFYRAGCGRDRRLEQLWGAPAKSGD